MRTIEYLGKQKQLQKARETLEVYAPLAHRLGIHTIKWELEDLAFQTLHPRKYAEIQAMVNERRADREKFVDEAGRTLERELEKVGIPAEISARAKHFYSIYEKMAKRGKEFNEIYDLTAMRVIVERDGKEGERDCYGALGIIHSLWKPMPGRFKDYVAMPKFNMYRSLHTTVIGPEGKPLEIQVRTQRDARDGRVRDRRALALQGRRRARRRRRSGSPGCSSSPTGSRRRPTRGELMRAFPELASDEVYVFTPKGEVKNLPAGSTPIDFAYAVHTDVGHRTVGAKVNGRIVPLHYRPEERRLRRDPHVEAGGPRAVARLALARRLLARPQQDPPVVQPRDARGDRAARPRVARERAEAAQPPVQEARGLAAPRAGHPRDGLQEGRGLLPRARLGQAPGRRRSRTRCSTA